MLRPERSGRAKSGLRLFQLVGMRDKIYFQEISIEFVVCPTSYLEGASTSEFESISRFRISQILASLVTLLGCRWTPDFFPESKISRFMAYLRQECGSSLRSVDIEFFHSII